MENKINIAELLKDCPKGMELDCVMWDNVVFDRVDEGSYYPIYIKKIGGGEESLTENGCFFANASAKCVIFPKGKTTWEGFVPSCKFKVGDKIRLKENHTNIYTITGIREKENKYECGVTFVLRFSEQDNWELVPNKFDINTLKPFDKVLVRDNNTQKWTADLFSFFDKSLVCPYSCVGHYTNQCIPYEGNEHLLGSDNDCADYYKNW